MSPSADFQNDVPKHNQQALNDPAAFTAVATKLNTTKAALVAKLNATATPTKLNATSAVASAEALKTLAAAGLTVNKTAAASGLASGTLTCWVTPDGLVAGLTSNNGNYMCARSAATAVSIPVGDGFISGVKIEVAKIGAPFVGRLTFFVSPRSGGLPAVVSCGSAGVEPGVPLPPTLALAKLAITNLAAQCASAPTASGRRLAATGTPPYLLSVATLKAATALPAASSSITGLNFNGVPVSGVLTNDQMAAVAAANVAGGQCPGGPNPLQIPTSNTYTAWPATSFVSPPGTQWPLCGGKFALCSFANCTMDFPGAQSSCVPLAACGCQPGGQGTSLGTLSRVDPTYILSSSLAAATAAQCPQGAASQGCTAPDSTPICQAITANTIYNGNYQRVSTYRSTSQGGFNTFCPANNFYAQCMTAGARKKETERKRKRGNGVLRWWRRSPRRNPPTCPHTHPLHPPFIFTACFDTPAFDGSPVTCYCPIYASPDFLLGSPANQPQPPCAPDWPYILSGAAHPPTFVFP